MKKSILILIPVISLFVLSGAVAQQLDIEEIQYSVKNNVPQEVLDAVESDYPGMNIQEHLLSPSVSLEEELKKQKQIENLPEIYPVYYALIKGKEYEKKADYNKEGKLISSTETIKNVALPRAVLNTIGREYNGWLVTKNQAERYTSSTYNNVLYEVWLKNGRKKQQLTIDATGKILVKKRSGN